MRHDDPRLSPYSPKDATIRSAIELASDVEGLLRQLEVLRAYIRAGSVAAAAYELGISETTARQRLSGLYRRTGCLKAAQAAYW